MIHIDGEEGGGQLLRSALTLSLLTGQRFSMANIRGKRTKPGLLRQHLTAVQACVSISGSRAEGAALQSRQITFFPERARAGEYTFSIGSAGSTTLVLQTVLLPLLFADGPSRLLLEGGTHNPMAPTFDFLQTAFLPILTRLGASVTVRLERYGFFPAGGGRITVEIEPCAGLAPLELRRRGTPIEKELAAIIADLPASIALREIEAANKKLRWSSQETRIREIPHRQGPGNVIQATLRCTEGAELFTAFGEKGVSAEKVGDQLATQVLDYIAHGAPVGPHLADQLLLPLAAGQGGVFVTGPLTDHFRTNADLIRQFSGTQVTVREEDTGTCEITVSGSGLGRA